MVRNGTRRVVVVDSPDRRFFEQAIFIVGAEAERTGISANQLVEQARQVARSYASGSRRVKRLGRQWGGAAWAAMGAAATGLVWLAAALI